MTQHKKVITGVDVYVTSCGNLAFLTDCEGSPFSGPTYRGTVWHTVRGKSQKYDLVWSESGICSNDERFHITQRV